MPGENIIPFSTEKKIVLITGCTRGLGRAMADGFVERGDTVIGGGRSEGALAKLQKKHGDPHRFLELDVSDERSVEAFCDRTVNEVGVPNLILNNAGVINKSAALWDITDEEFSKVLDVNVRGPASVIRHMVPYLISREIYGVVVNFSSGWGRSTAADVGPYCASKWAIEGLTQSLSQELPANVGVVALNPGVIHTEMLESCFGPNASSYPSPEEWARTAVPFLANLGPHDSGKSLTAP